MQKRLRPSAYKLISKQLIHSQITQHNKRNAPNLNHNCFIISPINHNVPIIIDITHLNLLQVNLTVINMPIAPICLHYLSCNCGGLQLNYYNITLAIDIGYWQWLLTVPIDSGYWQWLLTVAIDSTTFFIVLWLKKHAACLSHPLGVAPEKWSQRQIWLVIDWLI